MYIPREFSITDFQTIADFLREHPFGILLVNGEDGFPAAAHLPFLVKVDGEKIVLEGHLAKANDVEPYIAGNLPAKAIINGAHGYVSSSVYGHVNVPTYNYQTVHLSGQLQKMSAEELLVHVQEVVAAFEQNREKPIAFDNWPREMIRHYMQEITGFRLVVDTVEAAFKLSQNRNEADFRRIVEDLQKGNADQLKLAEAMVRYGAPQYETKH